MNKLFRSTRLAALAVITLFASLSANAASADGFGELAAACRETSKTPLLCNCYARVMSTNIEDKYLSLMATDLHERRDPKLTAEDYGFYEDYATSLGYIKSQCK